ncbi:MAG: ABC transporter ATP-binding protein/permease, partial [Christensenellaceae bacterium]|nr:ABC transporter ATP-binding protein/permease [Christensenellaceae bacterium]
IIAFIIQSLFEGGFNIRKMVFATLIAAMAIVVRFICNIYSSRMVYMSSKAVKKTLRFKIYKKLLKLGASYSQQVNTSELVQVTVEGVDQLEIFFGQYLPQLFYAVLAPLTLFIVISFISLPAAFVLLICVPLIPITIAAVQRWASRLLGKYWGEYTNLGDVFLENLQGLTTTKIYQSDKFKHEQMNIQSERFRKITMNVLKMQLNSISIMDLIAYGGAALGVVLATIGFQHGKVNLGGAVLIILLAADFFLPMRMLGSFFHIAMNGMAASDKIFRVLDLPEGEEKTESINQCCNIVCRNLRFSYEEDREIIKGIDMDFPEGSFTAIIGESGCGKSTLSSILMGRNQGYQGSVSVGGKELSKIREECLMKTFTYIGHQSYLFKGTVRDNLLMANPEAEDDALWEVLERMQLANFLRQEKGLDTLLNEKASNLSGGQCQRLALARALLHDSDVYIFDEATSNIDVESETSIMEQIKNLADKKTVILISHRLANVTNADVIYVMKDGFVVEKGTHEELLNKDTYSKLWNSQMQLESYRTGGERA